MQNDFCLNYGILSGKVNFVITLFKSVITSKKVFTQTVSREVERLVKEQGEQHRLA
jgi:hypothetical protein